ncbi:MarR family transcriptional regulator [Streptomyces sp. NBC_01478]|jgi:DNA-binding MarR family transcriptional regulator|uniref:MarR family winged helix-turn-helix transcriptional regulator n=1 Tax=Streptomyces sp. NBC_01478 TaxID=2903882 RepID=UPI002E367E8D|nr:MarR family transcriptional regulator [Streptomyces sp. NBC_01478]
MDPLSKTATGLLPHLLQLRTLLNRGQLYEQAVQEAGVALDRPAMTILVILDAAERPLRVGEIATRMQVVGPHVTRHLNSLEKRSIIKRVPDPEDQRARLIALTPSGQRIVQQYTAIVNGWFTAALAQWPDHDRTELIRLLTRLTGDLTTQFDAVAAGGTPARGED